MTRNVNTAAVAVASALALGAGGCSFLFARTPTPETAQKPGACEGRGLAAGADGALAALSGVALVASTSSGSGLGGDLKLYSQPWIVRHSGAIWPGVFVLAASSMVYGITKTSECNALRASIAPELRPVVPEPSPGAPGLAKPCPQCPRRHLWTGGPRRNRRTFVIRRPVDTSLGEPPRRRNPDGDGASQEPTEEMIVTRDAETQRCPCADVPPRHEAYSGWVSELVRAHRSRLVAVARHEGLGADDAFDAAQEAFAGFLMLPQARELAPSDWAEHTLVALVRNVARNARRLHAHARPHVSDEAALDALEAKEPAADERLAGVETRGRVERCVARLGDVQRAVVTLRMLDEKPGQDVARELGIEPNHVAVLLHRAKAQLRACLEGAGESRGGAIAA